MTKLNLIKSGDAANADLPFSVYTIYLADSQNRVIVGLSDDSAENIKLFKERICDSPMIEFEKESPVVNLSH